MIPLERISKRGSSKCTNCGCLNGNRAHFCKNKQCAIKLKSKKSPAQRLDSTNSSSSDVLCNLESDVLFSGVFCNLEGNDNSNVRLCGREEKEGPDDFMQWLSNVTERINGSVHFSVSGRRQPLVFQIPEKFFESLHERISSEGCNGKRRLPDSVTAGQFPLYTWHLTSLTQILRLFNTSQVQLQVIKFYGVTEEGGYVEVLGPPCPPPSGTLLAPGALHTLLRPPLTLQWRPTHKEGQLTLTVHFDRKFK